MRLGNRTRVSVLVSVGFAWVFVAGMLAQSDPQVGVWRLNVAKSKYTTVPSPKSGTTRIEAAGTGTRVVVDQEMSDGSKRHWEFTANYDGKDSPVKGNNPDADTIARKRIDPNTVESVSKKSGKATTTQTSTVSADGKTRTVRTSGVNASGQKVNNVAVYERQ